MRRDTTHGYRTVRPASNSDEPEDAAPQPKTPQGSQVPANQSAPRRSRAVKVHPPREIKPTGLVNLWWQAKKGILESPAPPRLTSKERAEITRIDRELYARLLEDEIRLVNQRRSWTAVTANVKGGAGKSPNACNLASVHSHVVRKSTTVVDNNPNWGTPGLLLGISQEETLTVRMLMEMLETGKVSKFSEFSGSLGSTKDGVLLVASDEVTRRNDKYDGAMARRIIQAAKDWSLFVVNDSGNDISEEVMAVSLDLSDVLIVSTLTTKSRYLGAVSTMKNFSGWGYRRMVRHAVVVVNGLEPGQTVEDFRAKLDLDDSQILMGIPYDERIKHDMVIDVSLMPLETYIAYLELDLVVSKMAKFLQTHQQDDSISPFNFKPGQLVALPSGRTPVLSYVKHNPRSGG